MFTCHKYHVTERGPYGGSGEKFSVRLYRVFGLPIFWRRRPCREQARA